MDDFCRIIYMRGIIRKVVNMDIFKFFKSKKLIVSIFIILVFIVILYLMYFSKNNSVTAIDEVEEINQEEVVNEEIKKIKVDIKGMVNNPGVYDIDDGSRVIDVINVSGGLIEGADTSNINLSKKLKDENVIIIGSIKEPEKVIEYVYKECECPRFNDACINNNEVVNFQDNNISSDVEEKKDNDLISINSADLETLMSLPSIGESKAKSIIKYREENDGFKQIEDIMNVSGIGNALFEKIKDFITL